jgi:hypothetical protein
MDIPLCASTTAVAGLSRQILAEINNVVPGILVDFTDPRIDMDTNQFPFLQQRAAESLIRAIRNRGQRMRINSAYRTCAQQFLLRRRVGNCDTPAAAIPGRSNHESGLALDVRDFLGWRPYLVSQGWAWFGTGDKVHFDYRGGGTPIGNIGIKAFQTLWNRNFPSQSIEADGVYGAMTAERLGISPSEGFNSGEIPRRVLRLTSPLMQGGDVHRVQTKLRTLGFLRSESDVDGVYGAVTETAVRDFQQSENLTVDGIVGDATYNKLEL